MGCLKGPDFLCIGMQKAGTGWIYDALCLSPLFRMMPIKEFHHFDSLARGRGDADEHHNRLLRAARNNTDKLPPDAFRAFESALARYLAAPTTENYLSLFDTKGEALSGDMTPAYSTLDAGQVAEVRAALPECRIVLAVREPVARGWSQFNMALRVAMKKDGITRAKDQQSEINRYATVDALANFVSKPKFLDRSSPSKTHEAWSAQFPDILVVDFQRIVAAPADALRDIVGFLADGQGAGLTIPVVDNRKAKEPKAVFSPAHRAVLEEALMPEIERARKTFPAIAANW